MSQLLIGQIVLVSISTDPQFYRCSPLKDDRTYTKKTQTHTTCCPPAKVCKLHPQQEKRSAAQTDGKR